MLHCAWYDTTFLSLHCGQYIFPFFNRTFTMDSRSGDKIYAQGSVLGPILFLIYINDLARAIIYSKLDNFADDTPILYSDTLNA